MMENNMIKKIKKRIQYLKRKIIVRFVNVETDPRLLGYTT
jgi:hypothetical protein